MKDLITYVDHTGKEHPALALSENQMHPGFVTLVYVKDGEPVKLFDVAHECHESKDENNPDLPRIALNCWKEYGDVSPSQPPAVIEATSDLSNPVAADDSAKSPDAQNEEATA